MTNEHHTPALHDDIVWDIPNIAVEINRTPRQTHYLIERGQLPVTKVGARKYAALRSELRRWFAETLHTPTPKDPIPPRDKPQPRIKSRVPKRKLHPRHD
jgi:hypothetical protein